MAYATGSAAGGADLLDKFRIFAMSLGWAADNWSTITVTSRWLHLHNAAGLHADFYWDGVNSQMFGLGATAFNGSALYTAQPGRSGRTRTTMTAGAFPSFWFFGDTEGVMCVVEITTGVFRHFGMGTYDKVGGYTGGFWVTSTQFNVTTSGYAYQGSPWDGLSYPSTISYPNTVSRCDIEGKTWWSSMSINGAAASSEWNSDAMATGSLRQGMEDSVAGRTPNTVNALSVLAPIRMLVNRGVSGLYSNIGTVKNIRAVTMSLLSPREEIVFGTDTWKVFPISQKATWVGSGVGQNLNGSYNSGIAYKIVP